MAGFMKMAVFLPRITRGLGGESGCGTEYCFSPVNAVLLSKSRGDLPEKEF